MLRVTIAVLAVMALFATGQQNTVQAAGPKAKPTVTATPNPNPVGGVGDDDGGP
jgi:hypothetical protein